MENGDVGRRAECGLIFCGEQRINFKGDETGAQGSEQGRECSVAGTNFNDSAGADVAEGVDDGLRGCVIDEKVLAEARL